MKSNRTMTFMMREPIRVGLISSPFEYRAVDTIDPSVRPAKTNEPSTPY